MAVINVIMFVLSVVILSTLPYIRSAFRPLEIIVYYMVILIAIEQIYSAIVDNNKLIQFSDSVSAFFFYKMNQLIVFPAATLWLFYSYFSVKCRFLLKALLTAVWIFGLSGAYFLFERIGIFKLTGWTMGTALIVWFIVLVESFCFILWFRKILRKREPYDSVSA